MPRTTLIRGTVPVALLALVTGCGSAPGEENAGADAATPGPPGSSTVPPAPVADASAPRGEDASSGGDSAPPARDGSPPADADPSSHKDATPPDSGGGKGIDAGPVGDGHVVFLAPGGDWTRIDVKTGAQSDLATVLAAQSGGKDQFANLSRDGAWLALVTSRFACSSGECLALARGDGSAASLVTTSGATHDVSGRPAVASGGALLVYPATGGPHAVDLFAITRAGNTWSAPRLLTAGSPAAYQHDLALSYDGARVAFVCGPSPYQIAGSSICEAQIDGSGTSVRVASTAGPGATASSLTHHPDYAPDGTLVFEADWSGSEEVWRASGATLARVSPAGVSDDNSPCVLPDGRIASLWLGRAGNPQNLHELKVMNPDGSGGAMLVTGVDLVDVGESCGW